MSHFSGAQCKRCRRLGVKLCSKGERGLGSKCALARRNYPPGVHGPKGYGRISDYGLHLQEKQKLRVIYGIMEKQLCKYFDEAKREKTNTGFKLLELLERRFDNIIYRLGLASSRRQARQMVGHNHFKVNGKKMNIPSYTVKRGDVITIAKEKSLTTGQIAENIKTMPKKEIPAWLFWDEQNKKGQVVELPQNNDLDVGVDTRLIVEFYSR